MVARGVAADVTWWPAILPASRERTCSTCACVRWSRPLQPRRTLIPQATSPTKPRTTTDTAARRRNELRTRWDRRRAPELGLLVVRRLAVPAEPLEIRPLRGAASLPRQLPPELHYTADGELHLEPEGDDEREPQRHGVAPVGRREEPRHDRDQQAHPNHADRARAHRHAE